MLIAAYIMNIYVDSQFYMSFQHTVFNSGNYKLLHKKIVNNVVINVGSAQNEMNKMLL